jgi:nucleotide-binding universal stress UspA family protein
MNATIRRILVPVDFSPHSDRAVSYATGLATRLDASIELLHVVEDPFLAAAWNPDIYIPDVTQTLTSLSDDAQAQLAIARAGVRAQGIPASGVVRRGAPAKTIVEHAGTDHFDLIVMGTHGRTGLSHALLGSVAERVLRHASCPVLTVTEVAALAQHAAAADAA